MHSPLPSVEELPRWLVHRTRHVGLLNNGRLRLMLVALVCIALGFITTSSFGPSDDMADSNAPMADYGYATGVLEGPTTYTGDAAVVKTAKTGKRPPGAYEDGDVLADAREPSIKGALKELHSAVSGKLKAWRPGQNTNPPGTGGVSTSSDTGVEGTARGKTNKTNTSLATEELLAPDRDTLGERTRVGKCTIILYGASIYERAVRTHEAHDRLHGYPLHVLRHGLLDDVWTKPAYILSLLLRELARPEDERLQWLLWVDADTILLNPYVAVETFLPPSPEFDDVHLLVSHDWNGLNNGVFPVRVNQWAVDLFAAIVSFRHFRPDAPLVFRDQSAMDTLLQERKFAMHTVEAPQRWFNAYQGEHNETLAPFQVRRGDFLVHFAGVGDRNERMSYWLERAEAHLPDWEMEVQHTTYPAEVRDFWHQQRELRSDQAQNVLGTRKKANDLLLQTDTHMAEYQDRLQEESVQQITKTQRNLRQVLEKQDVEPAEIEAAVDSLTEATGPLSTVMQGAQKILLKEAHESIFAAEKDMLEYNGEPGPEVYEVETKASNLKSLVLQASWQKSELSTAIDQLRQARARLQEKKTPGPEEIDAQKEAAAQAQEQKMQDEEAAKEKAEILGAEAAVPTLTHTELGEFFVTHTSIAYAQETIVNVVIQTTVMA